MTDSIQTASDQTSTLLITEKEREIYWEAAAIDRGKDRYRAVCNTVKYSCDGTVKHERSELVDVALSQIILKEILHRNCHCIEDGLGVFFP